MNKKRKRFMKLELLETSAVGTPAYADAHFSLFKSLSNAYQDLKGGHVEKMAEEEVATEVVAESETKTEEAVVETETEEKVEEVKEEVKDEETEKSVKMDKMDELIATIKEAITKMPVERALVENKVSAADRIKSASAGELLLAMLNK